MRETSTARNVRAGCFVCHADDVGWTGPNSQGVAARHHDATGHATWVEVELFVYYGKEQSLLDERLAEKEEKDG